MGQALYRKYRSKSLDEIVGQEHITTALANAIKTERISHAYLFTGPRGVGKTSIARIFAHQINNLAYDEESNHIDIIEIDAASNRRIDEIRDLRDRVYIAPAAAKYKVYIIDEVHMLTKEAFNALLKTLEEPPAHVVFILATTEAQKLPATIVSRTQRYVFRPIDKDKVVKHLKSIAKSEKIKISDDALALIADHGEGSFRDSISLLDQAGNHDGQIDIDTVRKLVGLAPEEALSTIIKAISDGDKLAIIRQLSELFNQGYSAAQLAIQLNQQLRQSIINQSPLVDEQEIYNLMSNLIEVPAASLANQALELALLKATITKTPPVVKATTVESTTTVIEKPIKRSDIKPTQKNEAKPPVTTNFDPKDWPKVLQTLKSKHNTLYSIAKQAQVYTNDDGKLELKLSFAFHQKRLSESKNSQIIKAIMSDICGSPTTFSCIVGKITPESPKLAPVETISTVSNIFGGGEVLS